MNCVYAKYKLDQSAHFFPWKTYRRQVQIRQKNAFPEATTMMLNFAVLQINFSSVSLAKSTDLIVFSYCGVSME